MRIGWLLCDFRSPLAEIEVLTLLRFLGVEYKINQEIERVVFTYIDYLIHQLPVKNMDSNAQFNISHS
jgi:hypothetical protein